MPAHRIISLLPGATEMIAALDATDRLIGISHECDWPAEVQDLPRVTATAVDARVPSGQIDAQVRSIAASGAAVIGIDAHLLATLQPDLIITQTLCDVCAVSDGEAVRVALAMADPPQVLSLQGTTLDGVFRDIAVVAETVGVPERGATLCEQLMATVSSLTHQFARPDPPTVVVIEWLDPCFLAGHWTPDMVAAAGGRDVGMLPGQHSVARAWRDVMALDPAVVVVALCGFDEARARQELEVLPHAEVHAWLARRRVMFLDGNAYTSRAGPRVVEGISVIGEFLRG
jgi:iron complex transport system substrate-binding protein